MTVNEVIIILRKAGCRASYSGNLLTITGIPSWRIFLLARQYINDLSICFLVADVFSVPPKIDYDEDYSNACGYCKYQFRKHCPYYGQEDRMPVMTERKGCDLYKAGEHVRF